MLIIRLQRVGKKHQPHFRVVLAEKHKSPTKKVIEILGTYNPRNKEFTMKDKERVEYWLGQNVEVSATVHNLLASQGLASGKVKAWRPKVSTAAKAKADSAEGAAPKEQDKEAEPAAKAAPAEEAKGTEEKAEVAEAPAEQPAEEPKPKTALAEEKTEQAAEKTEASEEKATA